MSERTDFFASPVGYSLTGIPLRLHPQQSFYFLLLSLFLFHVVENSDFSLFLLFEHEPAEIETAPMTGLEWRFEY